MRKAVIVEPEIPENTGFIARLAANFNFKLRPVNPEFNLEKARKTAKNAQQKLREARIYDSVEKAVEDLEYVVGTKPGQQKTLNGFQPRENTSVMIGRESTGLTNEELELCDTTISISTGEYSSINQSHAAAILFHRFHEDEGKEGTAPGQKQKIRELAPEKVAETVIASNPSKGRAGKIIEELRKSDQEAL